MNDSDFKQTEIGLIPEDWELVKLGNESIAKIRGNKTINGFERVAFIPMEYIPDSNIFVKYEMRPREAVKSFIYCERGDLLLAKITPSLENGKQGIVPNDVPNGFALATTEVFPIWCKGIEKLFLFYVLKFSRFRNKIISSMIGTTGRQRASKESVENLFIPFPPLPEQKKIAEVLLTVDQDIEEIDESITKTERLKKGLMQELLTKGIGHEKFKETEIGKIPEEWKIIKLENLLSLEYGEGLTERERKGSEYPVYGSNGIVGYNSKYLVKGPGIVVGRKGTIGAIRWSEDNFWPIDTTYYVKLKELETDLRWLFYKLSTLGLSKLNMATGTPGLNRDLVYKLKISFPSLTEQKKIAKILSIIDDRIQLLKDKKSKLERVKKGLMNELLTGRKRVKV